MAAPDRARSGALLLELLLALALGGVVLVALLRGLVGASQWLESMAARAELQEAVRTVWIVLEEEVGAGLPGRDWSVQGDGSLELRAFRGYGRVCKPGPGGAGASVTWRGLRAPDPARDSLLVLWSDGGWRVAPLLEVEPGGGGCDLAAGERRAQLAWGWGTPPLEPVLIRYFERGRYSLENRAFRYRRGDGGRQPLTTEIFSGESSFGEVGGRLRVRLVPLHRAPLRTVEWWVRGPPLAGGGR